MMGYELDRALILRKSEKSLFEIDISSTWLPGSKRISDLASDDSEQPKSNSRGGIETLEDRIMQRGLEKFSKLKNKAELDAEITRIKSDLHRYQIELVCLENMIFASEHDSKSQSERKSSHGQALPVPAGKDLRGESESIPQVQRASLKNELEEGERASFFASASRLEDVA